MDQGFEFVDVERIPPNQLSLKRRSGGTNVLDVLLRAKNLRIAAMIAAVLDDPDSDSDYSDDSDDDLDEEENDQLEEIAAIHLQRVVDIDAPRRISQRVIPIKFITVNSYSDDECWRLLRFKKDDITKLIELLGMPPFFRSESRHRYTREFSFILLLRRMAYPGRLTDLEQEFGRDHTSLSRSIGITVAWIDSNHSFRVTDNLQFWMQYQQPYADAVAAKTDIPAQFSNVNSFLDGTQKSFCRPSDGHNRPHDAQNKWYSGYYRAHGMKFQSMMYPSGKYSSNQRLSSRPL
jgi:hypothetical protein